MSAPSAAGFYLAIYEAKKLHITTQENLHEDFAFISSFRNSPLWRAGRLGRNARGCRQWPL